MVIPKWSFVIVIFVFYISTSASDDLRTQLLRQVTQQQAESILRAQNVARNYLLQTLTVVRNRISHFNGYNTMVENIVKGLQSRELEPLMIVKDRSFFKSTETPTLRQLAKAVYSMQGCNEATDYSISRWEAMLNTIPELSNYLTPVQGVNIGEPEYEIIDKLDRPFVDFVLLAVYYNNLRVTNALLQGILENYKFDPYSPDLVPLIRNVNERLASGALGNFQMDTSGQPASEDISSATLKRILSSIGTRADLEPQFGFQIRLILNALEMDLLGQAANENDSVADWLSAMREGDYPEDILQARDELMEMIRSGLLSSKVDLNTLREDMMGYSPSGRVLGLLARLLVLSPSDPAAAKVHALYSHVKLQHLCKSELSFVPHSAADIALLLNSFLTVKNQVNFGLVQQINEIFASPDFDWNALYRDFNFSKYCDPRTLLLSMLKHIAQSYNLQACHIIVVNYFLQQNTVVCTPSTDDFINNQLDGSTTPIVPVGNPSDDNSTALTQVVVDKNCTEGPPIRVIDPDCLIEIIESRQHAGFIIDLIKYNPVPAEKFPYSTRYAVFNAVLGDLKANKYTDDVSEFVISQAMLRLTLNEKANLPPTYLLLCPEEIKSLESNAPTTQAPTSTTPSVITNGPPMGITSPTLPAILSSTAMSITMPPLPIFTSSIPAITTSATPKSTTSTTPGTTPVPITDAPTPEPSTDPPPPEPSSEEPSPEPSTDPPPPEPSSEEPSPEPSTDAPPPEPSSEEPSPEPSTDPPPPEPSTDAPPPPETTPTPEDQCDDTTQVIDRLSLWDSVDNPQKWIELKQILLQDIVLYEDYKSLSTKGVILGTVLEKRIKELNDPRLNQMFSEFMLMCPVTDDAYLEPDVVYACHERKEDEPVAAAASASGSASGSASASGSGFGSASANAQDSRVQEFSVTSIPRFTPPSTYTNTIQNMHTRFTQKYTVETQTQTSSELCKPSEELTLIVDTDALLSLLTADAPKARFLRSRVRSYVIPVTPEMNYTSAETLRYILDAIKDEMNDARVAANVEILKNHVQDWGAGSQPPVTSYACLPKGAKITEMSYQPRYEMKECPGSVCSPDETVAAVIDTDSLFDALRPGAWKNPQVADRVRVYVMPIDPSKNYKKGDVLRDVLRDLLKNVNDAAAQRDINAVLNEIATGGYADERPRTVSVCFPKAYLGGVAGSPPPGVDGLCVLPDQVPTIGALTSRSPPPLPTTPLPRFSMPNLQSLMSRPTQNSGPSIKPESLFPSMSFLQHSMTPSSPPPNLIPAAYPSPAAPAVAGTSNVQYSLPTQGVYPSMMVQPSIIAAAQPSSQPPASPVMLASENPNVAQSSTLLPPLDLLSQPAGESAAVVVQDTSFPTAESPTVLNYNTLPAKNQESRVVGMFEPAFSPPTTAPAYSVSVTPFVPVQNEASSIPQSYPAPTAPPVASVSVESTINSNSSPWLFQYVAISSPSVPQQLDGSGASVVPPESGGYTAPPQVPFTYTQPPASDTPGPVGVTMTSDSSSVPIYPPSPMQNVAVASPPQLVPPVAPQPYQIIQMPVIYSTPIPTANPTPPPYQYVAVSPVQPVPPAGYPVPQQIAEVAPAPVGPAVAVATGANPEVPVPSPSQELQLSTSVAPIPTESTTPPPGIVATVDVASPVQLPAQGDVAQASPVLPISPQPAIGMNPYVPPVSSPVAAAATADSNGTNILPTSMAQNMIVSVPSLLFQFVSLQPNLTLVTISSAAPASDTPSVAAAANNNVTPASSDSKEPDAVVTPPPAQPQQPVASNPAAVETSVSVVANPAVVEPSVPVASKPAVVEPSVPIASNPAVDETSVSVASNPAVVESSVPVASNPAVVESSVPVASNPAVDETSVSVAANPAADEPSVPVASNPVTDKPPVPIAASPLKPKPASDSSPVSVGVAAAPDAESKPEQPEITQPATFGSPLSPSVAVEESVPDNSSPIEELRSTVQPIQLSGYPVLPVQTGSSDVAVSVDSAPSSNGSLMQFQQVAVSYPFQSFQPSNPQGVVLTQPSAPVAAAADTSAIGSGYPWPFQYVAIASSSPLPVQYPSPQPVSDIPSGTSAPFAFSVTSDSSGMSVFTSPTYQNVGFSLPSQPLQPANLQQSVPPPYPSPYPSAAVVAVSNNSPWNMPYLPVSSQPQQPITYQPTGSIIVPSPTPAGPAVAVAVDSATNPSQDTPVSYPQQPIIYQPVADIIPSTYAPAGPAVVVSADSATNPAPLPMQGGGIPFSYQPMQPYFPQSPVPILTQPPSPAGPAVAVAVDTATNTNPPLVQDVGVSVPYQPMQPIVTQPPFATPVQSQPSPAPSGPAVAVAADSPTNTFQDTPLQPQQPIIYQPAAYMTPPSPPPTLVAIAVSATMDSATNPPPLPVQDLGVSYPSQPQQPVIYQPLADIAPPPPASAVAASATNPTNADIPNIPESPVAIPTQPPPSPSPAGPVAAVAVDSATNTSPPPVQNPDMPLPYQPVQPNFPQSAVVITTQPPYPAGPAVAVAADSDTNPEQPVQETQFSSPLQPQQPVIYQPPSATIQPTYAPAGVTVAVAATVDSATNPPTILAQGLPIPYESRPQQSVNYQPSTDIPPPSPSPAGLTVAIAATMDSATNPPTYLAQGLPVSYQPLTYQPSTDIPPPSPSPAVAVSVGIATNPPSLDAGIPYQPVQYDMPQSATAMPTRSPSDAAPAEPVAAVAADSASSSSPELATPQPPILAGSPMSAYSKPQASPHLMAASSPLARPPFSTPQPLNPVPVDSSAAAGSSDDAGSVYSTQSEMPPSPFSDDPLPTVNSAYEVNPQSSSIATIGIFATESSTEATERPALMYQGHSSFASPMFARPITPAPPQFSSYAQDMFSPSASQQDRSPIIDGWNGGFPLMTSFSPFIRSSVTAPPDYQTSSPITPHKIFIPQGDAASASASQGSPSNAMPPPGYVPVSGEQTTPRPIAYTTTSDALGHTTRTASEQEILTMPSPSLQANDNGVQVSVQQGFDLEGMKQCNKPGEVLTKLISSSYLIHVLPEPLQAPPVTDAINNTHYLASNYINQTNYDILKHILTDLSSSGNMAVATIAKIIMYKLTIEESLLAPVYEFVCLPKEEVAQALCPLSPNYSPEKPRPPPSNCTNPKPFVDPEALLPVLTPAGAEKAQPIFLILVNIHLSWDCCSHFGKKSELLAYLLNEMEREIKIELTRNSMEELDQLVDDIEFVKGSILRDSPADTKPEPVIICAEEKICTNSTADARQEVIVPVRKKIKKTKIIYNSNESIKVLVQTDVKNRSEEDEVEKTEEDKGGMVRVQDNIAATPVTDISGTKLIQETTEIYYNPTEAPEIANIVLNAPSNPNSSVAYMHPGNASLPGYYELLKWPILLKPEGNRNCYDIRNQVYTSPVLVINITSLFDVINPTAASELDEYLTATYLTSLDTYYKTADFEFGNHTTKEQFLRGILQFLLETEDRHDITEPMKRIINLIPETNATPLQLGAICNYRIYQELPRRTPGSLTFRYVSSKPCQSGVIFYEVTAATDADPPQKIKRDMETFSQLASQNRIFENIVWENIPTQSDFGQLLMNVMNTPAVQNTFRDVSGYLQREIPRRLWKTSRVAVRAMCYPVQALPHVS